MHSVDESRATVALSAIGLPDVAPGRLLDRAADAPWLAREMIGGQSADDS
jgi:hypothetical protein